LWTILGLSVSAAAVSSQRSQRSFQLTDRDLAMASFVDRVGRATTEQVRERFGLSERVAWRRLRALRETGHVRSWRPYVGPAILYPRGAGEPRLRDLDHSLAATSVAVELELRGADVVTERTMIRDGRLAEDRSIWTVPVSSQSDPFKKLKHLPDLAVRTEEGLVAIEVELTRKGKQRLGRLMSAWAIQSIYREVLYICGSSQVERVIVEQAKRTGADEVVRPMSAERFLAELDVSCELPCPDLPSRRDRGRERAM